MIWVTRENARVDRVACPWLIRRFIDPEARFLFVPDDQVLEVAGREQAISFDAPGARFERRDGKCIFETMMELYELTDPALRRLGRIVHGANIPVDLYDCPEAAGLKAMAHGFALTCRDDHERLERQFPIYDALYAWCESRVKTHRLKTAAV